MKSLFASPALAASTSVAVLALAGAVLFAGSCIQPAGAAFPGENGLIAFDTGGEGSSSDIWVIGADGGGEEQLTNTPDFDYNPRFSPDGTKIAFSRGQPQANIWVMDADGGNPTQLTHEPGSENVGSWSPDGTKIAYYVFGDPGGIRVIDASGGNPQVITDGAGNESSAAWSPDGTKIASAWGGSVGAAADIWVVDLGSSKVTRLTTNAAFDGAPDWSPDGSKIAFDSLRDGNWEIYVMDANGDNETNVTHNSGAGPAGLDRFPVWSPDGSKIAFQSGRTGTNYEVWMMNANGSDPTQVTHRPISDDTPGSWQPLVHRGLKGDLNCDGDVDIDDMMRDLKHVGGFDEPIDGCPAIGAGTPPFGEITCDPQIDGVDALALARHVAKVPFTLHDGCRAIGT